MEGLKYGCDDEEELIFGQILTNTEPASGREGNEGLRPHNPPSLRTQESLGIERLHVLTPNPGVVVDSVEIRDDHRVLRNEKTVEFDVTECAVPDAGWY